MRIPSRALVGQHSFVSLVHTIAACARATPGSLQAKSDRLRRFHQHWPTEHSNISLAPRPQHVVGSRAGDLREPVGGIVLRGAGRALLGFSPSAHRDRSMLVLTMSGHCPGDSVFARPEAPRDSSITKWTLPAHRGAGSHRNHTHCPRLMDGPLGHRMAGLVVSIMSNGSVSSRLTLDPPRTDLALGEVTAICGFCCTVPPKRRRGNSVALHGQRVTKQKAWQLSQLPEQRCTAFARTGFLVVFVDVALVVHARCASHGWEINAASTPMRIQPYSCGKSKV